jgi:hypothetical protein
LVPRNTKIVPGNAGTVPGNAENQNEQVSFSYASRLLFSKAETVANGSFTVLSRPESGTFRKRNTDCLDKSSMLDALRLPSSLEIPVFSKLSMKHGYPLF